MLKLKVKPTGNLGLQEIQYYSMTVSPDLSYISGRTSYYNALLNGETVKVVNNETKFVNLCTINTENVKVQGKVMLEVTLPIKTVSKYVLLDSSPTYESTKITVNYVEYKGVCSYEKQGSFLIDGKLYNKNNNDTVTINTYEYIEDGFVTINGVKYIANYKKGNEIPEIYENKTLKPLRVNQRLSDNITFLGVSEYTRSEWRNDTKFYIYKKESDELVVDDVLFGGYNHYIIYNGENVYLKELYKTDENGFTTYVGYGVEIDGEFYTDILRQIYDGDGNTGHYNDENFAGSLIKIGDEYYDIQDSLVSPDSGGRFVFVVTHSEKIDLKEGMTIIAKSNDPIKSTLYVENEETYEYHDAQTHRYVGICYKIDDNTYLTKNGEQIDLEDYYIMTNIVSYVTYMGKRYDVTGNSYSAITVSDTEYRLIEDVDEHYSVVNGNKIYYNVEDGKAVPTNKIYYNIGTNEDVRIAYGIYENGYEIKTYSGVTIGETMYKVLDEEQILTQTVNNIDDEGNITSVSGITGGFDSRPHIEINEDMFYNLAISGQNGSKTYICYPSVTDNGIYTNSEIDAISRYISDMVVRHRDNFTFYVRNDIFGGEMVYPEIFAYDAFVSTKPTTSMDKLNISIFKVNTYLNVKFPIVNDLSNDILREDIINSYYSEDIKKAKRSTIVDMEKDVYYPVYVAGTKTYHPVLNVRFNLHFRTRQLDTWKVIEDYVEDANRGMSNWFVTDYKYYKKAINQEINFPNEPHTIHNASDLLGYMYFTTSEIKNRANKIGKSFLRLSFYSTDNPQTQTLLDTSTIFLDDAYLAKKVFSLQKSAKAGTFIRTQAYELYDNPEEYESEGITADSEYDYEDDGLYNFSATTTARLSSSLNVYDKGITNNSSEGFYFYMFREFSDNMRPNRIYMRVDFNHAGIGRTIPFMLPRKFDDESKPDGEPLYIHKEEDLKRLKKGFKLKDIYKQLYIPIDVIFDDKTNKYVYYLPNSLRENNELGVSNEVMEFNLFEVKFKDESEVENESNQ